MKLIKLKYILFSFLIYGLFLCSCQKDFIFDRSYAIDSMTDTVGLVIKISPEWEVAEYKFYIQNAGNSAYSMIDKPDWLITGSDQIIFINDTASINLKAKKTKEFSRKGAYYNRMLLRNNDGNKILVSLIYLIEE